MSSATLAAPKSLPKTPMKFRLLIGLHQQNDPAGRMEFTGDRDPVSHAPIQRPVTITYKPGDEFESDVDLVARFNSEGSTKFERIDFTSTEINMRTWMPERETLDQFTARMKAGQEVNPVAQAAQAGFNTLHTDVARDDTLQAMSVTELKKFAESEEIDLGTANRKEDIIRVIRNAQAAHVG